MNVGVELKNIRKKLGPNQALDGVNTLFGAGQLHGLIGPDGAGKTTLLRTLMGLLKPNEGEINYFNVGAQHVAPNTQEEGFSGEWAQHAAPLHPEKISFEELRPHMAYMPQQQSLYPDLSIGEHLDFFRDLYQIPKELYRERREELLRITRLDKFTDRAAGKLSGGMYKKLGLMCALLQSPTVLLLDEPTNGVDPISRREFWDLLYRLKEQKILIIIATAYMDEAERCGVVHLLDQGKMLAAGEPRAVLEKEGVSRFEELFLRQTPAAV